jgi:hypothetical protein
MAEAVRVEHLSTFGPATRQQPSTSFTKLKMSARLGRTEVLSLLSLSLACIGTLANTLHGDGEPLIASIAFSGLAFSFTYALIRWLGNAFMRAGLKGKDLSKLRQVEMYVGNQYFSAHLTNLLLLLTYVIVQKPWALFVPLCIFLQSLCLFHGRSTKTL